LVTTIYRGTERLPESERYGLKAQCRRAVVSVAANITEGCGRGTEGELARFLRIAAGSAAELETLVLLCSDLGLVGNDEGELLRLSVIDVRKMLTALTRRIESDRRSRQRG